MRNPHKWRLHDCYPRNAQLRSIHILIGSLARLTEQAKPGSLLLRCVTLVRVGEGGLSAIRPPHDPRPICSAGEVQWDDELVGEIKQLATPPPEKEKE